MKRSWSLTVRLVTLLAIILTAGTAIFGLAALAYGRQAADEAYDRLLSGAAFQISEQVIAEQGRIVVDLPVAAFDLLALAPRDRVFYRILTEDGTTITGDPDLAAPPDRTPLAGNRRSTPVIFSTRYSDEPIRAVALRKQFTERDVKGQVIIVVGQTQQARNALAADIARKALLLLMIAGMVTLACVGLAIRLSLRPLHRIETELVRRDPKDLSPLRLTPPREVKALAEAIDGFMARLKRRVDVTQTLVSDAAHQLRTPITAIRAQAEIGRDETSPEILRDIVSRIHRRSIGLARLADQLLSQATMIHRGEAVPLAPVDLNEIVRRAVEECMQSLPLEPDAIELALPSGAVLISGDAFSLVEAVKNLISNGLRHGVAPVRIAVAADRGDGASLQVEDQGTGIPEAHWPEIGNRFFRPRGNDAEGAGLGLAIACAVVESHGGRIALARPNAGGFRFTLHFPPASRQAGDLSFRPSPEATLNAEGRLP
jgi:two-component system, OmpR family, sensor histidine kinase TctE